MSLLDDPRNRRPLIASVVLGLALFVLLWLVLSWPPLIAWLIAAGTSVCGDQLDLQFTHDALRTIGFSPLLLPESIGPPDLQLPGCARAHRRSPRSGRRRSSRSRASPYPGRLAWRSRRWSYRFRTVPALSLPATTPPS